MAVLKIFRDAVDIAPLLLCVLRSFCKVLKKQRNGFDAFQVVEDAVVFVRGVDGVTVESESHHDDFGFEFLFEQCYDRNASSGAHGYCRNAKRFAVGTVCRAVSDAVNRCDIALSAVVRCDFHLYAAGCEAGKMFGEKFGDFFPILIRDESHGDFRVRFAGYSRPRCR